MQLPGAGFNGVLQPPQPVESCHNLVFQRAGDRDFRRLGNIPNPDASRDIHRAGSRFEPADENLKQRGFAAAVGSDDADTRPFVDLHVYVRENHVRAVGYADA